MKRNLFLFILVLSSVSLWSQDVVVLDEEFIHDTNDEIVIASQRVILGDGFSVTPIEGERVVFMVGDQGDLKSRVSVVNTIAIDEKPVTSVVVYPNPVEHSLNVDARGDEKILNVEIFSITGGREFSTTNLCKTNNLDVSHLSQGIHVVAVVTDRGRFSFRLIKK